MLFSDSSKAEMELAWIPEITLEEMIVEMMSHDLDEAKQYGLLKANGYYVAVSKES